MDTLYIQFAGGHTAVDLNPRTNRSGVHTFSQKTDVRFIMTLPEEQKLERGELHERNTILSVRDVQSTPVSHSSSLNFQNRSEPGSAWYWKLAVKFCAKLVKKMPKNLIFSITTSNRSKDVAFLSLLFSY